MESGAKTLKKKAPLTPAEGNIYWTPLHECAWNGNIHLIPKETLTEDQPLQPDNEGNTPIHWAASQGHLLQIPKEFLTQKNLLNPNTQKATPLHGAARQGHLDQIPREILTEENLLIPDEDGQTTLHAAAEASHLDRVPLKLQISTLKMFLESPPQLGKEFPEKSKTWLKQEIKTQRKDQMQEVLQHSPHPDL